MIFLIITIPSFSQKKNNINEPATPGQSSVFADNQSQEKSGLTPSKWNVLSGKCIIEKSGTEGVISLTGDETKISPNADIASLLSKGFEASFELYYSNGQRYYCRIFPYPDIEFKQTEISCGDHVSELTISKPASEYSWQKIMIKCEVSQINIYVNGKLELTIPDAGKIPDNFALGNWQTGGEKYYVKNVTIIGSGKKSEPQNQQVKLILPANNSKVYDKSLQFSWKSGSLNKNSKFILSVFKMEPGQSPEEAILNHPCFQKEGINFVSQKYLLASKSIERGKNYCWNVKQIIGAMEYLSETRIFKENSTMPLKFPESKIQCDTNGTLVKGVPCKSVIQKVIGKVEVEYEPGKWKDAVNGMEITEGMRVCTSEGSSAVLAFGTSGVALLSSTTLAEIKKIECNEDGLNVELFIDPGACTVSIKKLAQFATDFQVSTPRLTCSVRG